MKNLTREQIKIIYYSLIIAVFLGAFWFFVYGPQNKKLSSMKEELAYIESQIAEIKEITKGRELTEIVGDFNDQLAKSASFLILKDKEIIYNLSQEARKLNIEVSSIMPSNKQLLEDKVTGIDIEELPISMKLVCEFRDLGMYLEILRNNFPVLAVVKRLDIRGQGEKEPILDVDLQISAYLTKGR